MRNDIKRFFSRMYMVLAVSLAIIALCILFGSSATIGKATFETQSPTNTNTDTKLNTGFSPTVEARLIETRITQYVEKPVTQVKYVERVKMMPVELRDFDDPEGLRKWLTTTTTIYFKRPELAIDCDDYAVTLQRKALADGYIMSLQVIEPNRYNLLFERGKIPTNTLHAINLVIIGNEAYYIEPQTGEIVLAAQLD